MSSFVELRICSVIIIMCLWLFCLVTARTRRMSMGFLHGSLACAKRKLFEIDRWDGANGFAQGNPKHDLRHVFATAY